MTETRIWPFGGGTLESNIEGFELLRGDKLRAAILALPDDDPWKQAVTAQGIEAGTDETAKPVRPEGREPGGEAMRPESIPREDT